MLVSPGIVKHHEKTGAWPSTEANSDCSWGLLTGKEDTYNDIEYLLQLTDSKLPKEFYQFSIVEDLGHFKRVQIMQ